MAPSDAAPARGVPIAQTFVDGLGADLSLVATPGGVSCIASRTLPIRDSDYRDPDGSTVAFDRISRSPASSIQAIARPDMPVAFRVQLKYPVKAGTPIHLETGGETLDLAETLEPSRDSLWLTGGPAEALSAALAGGTAPTVRGVSAETGRTITDRIDAPDMAGLDACLESLVALEAEAAGTAPAHSDTEFVPVMPAAARPASATTATGDGDAGGAAPEIVVRETGAETVELPVPVSGVRVELVARPDPAARLSIDDLQGCRMRDVPDELYLGRLTHVTGFFSPTRDVYVAFDADGRLMRAYVPGIFDSELADGTNSARLSLAADANVPDRPQTVRGCLGDARLHAPICVYPAPAAHSYVLAECGVLGVADERIGGGAAATAWPVPASFAAAGIGMGGAGSARGGGAPPSGGGGGWSPGGAAPPSGGGGGWSPGGAAPPSGGGGGWSPGGAAPPSGGGGGWPPGGAAPPAPGGGSRPPPGVTPFLPDDSVPPPGVGPGEPRLPAPPPIPPIPLPTAVSLLLGGLASLAGLAALRRRAGTA